MAQVTEPGAVDPPFPGALGSTDTAAARDAFERAARALIAVCVFLVPVVFDPRTVDSFNLTKVTILWICVASATVLWLAAIFVGDGRPRANIGSSVVVRSAVALLAITAAATLFSASRTLSVFGLYHRYGGVVSLTIYVALAVLIVALYHHRLDALHDLAVALAAAAFLVTVYVFVQHAHADPYRWRLAEGRPGQFPIGTMGNSEFTSAFLGMAFPFVVYLGLAARNAPRRAAWSAVGAVTLVGVWWTQGRSGMLAALAGTVAVLVLRSRRRPVRVVVAVFASLLVLAVVPVVAARRTVRSTVLRTESLQYRRETWDAAWRMVLERPELGWGPETYFGLYPRFRSAADGRTHGLTIPDKPHNIYLDWASSTGIAGLGAFLVLIGAALATAARGGPGERRLLTAAFGGGLVAYLVQGVYSIDVPPLALVGWVSLGAIGAFGAGAAKRDRATASARPTSWFRRPLVVATAAGLVGLFALGAGLGPWRADRSAWAAEQRSGAGWSDDTMRTYEQAIALNPREAAYRGLAAAYLERVAADTGATDRALRRAASLYEQAVALQPRNIYFMINAARVDARLGSSGDAAAFARADRWLRRVVTLDPRDPEARDAYADLVTQWSKTVKDERARAGLEQRARAERAAAQRLRAG